MDDSTKADQPANDTREPHQAELAEIARGWRLRTQHPDVVEVLRALAGGDAQLIGKMAELARKAERSIEGQSRRTDLREVVAQLHAWDGRDPSALDVADALVFAALSLPVLEGRLDLHADNPASDRALARVASALTVACDSPWAEGRDARGIVLARAGLHALGLSTEQARNALSYIEKG